MNALAQVSRPSTPSIGPSSLRDAQPLGRDERAASIELSIDEQMLVLAGQFPRRLMLLVAAAHALPRTAQSGLLEDGRRVAERARLVYDRLNAAIAEAADARSLREQEAILSEALAQARAGLTAMVQFARATDARSPGCVQRAIEWTEAFVAERRREEKNREKRRLPLCDWDYVLGEWSTREAILLRRHAMPGLDGYEPRWIHADDDWR
jgi:hypothetical protein